MSYTGAFALLIRLILQVSEVLPGEALELNAVLDEHRVELQHLVIVFLVERALNVEAHVVDSAGSHVPARAFQLVHAEFHLNPVSLVDTISNLS